MPGCRSGTNFGVAAWVRVAEPVESVVRLDEDCSLLVSFDRWVLRVVVSIVDNAEPVDDSSASIMSSDFDRQAAHTNSLINSYLDSYFTDTDCNSAAVVEDSDCRSFTNIVPNSYFDPWFGKCY